MRLLLTSTFLSGLVLLPQMAFAQSVSRSEGASDPSLLQTQSLFSAGSIPTLRGSDPALDLPPNANDTPNRQDVNGSIDPSSGRILYPVKPVGPASPGQQSVAPVPPTQGSAFRGRGEQSDFDPVGVTFGTFLLYPSLSVFTEATDNIDNAQNGEAGVSGRVELEVTAQSLWRRHVLALGARGVFQSYQTPDRKPDNEVSLDADLTLDLADQSQLALSARMERQREEANNPDLVASGGEASVETAYNLSASLDQGAGAFKLQLRGALDREVFEEDASRDVSTYTFGGRIGYEVTDQVLPFVDVEVAQIRYDDADDSLDGQSLCGAIGVEVINRDKVSGEVSAGILVWDAESARIDADTIFFADASLNWSPNALWTLRSTLGTNLTSSSTSATSVATRSLSVEADYAARRDLTLSFDSSLAHEDYNGSDRRDWVFDATLGAEYAFNRSVQLIARLSHERRDSSAAGSDFASSKIEVGVKFQR